MMGVDIDRRGELMEVGIETLKQAWTGDEFEFNGVPSQVGPARTRNRDRHRARWQLEGRGPARASPTASCRARPG
jgi:hypothetical protein